MKMHIINDMVELTFYQLQKLVFETIVLRPFSIFSLLGIHPDFREHIVVPVFCRFKHNLEVVISYL